MRFYYTTKSGAEQVNKTNYLSLGLYKSSTPVPNAGLNNLFGDVTVLAEKNSDRDRFIGLVLKNESGADVTGLKLWFTSSETAYTQYEVAVVAMAQDSDGNYYMEDIENKYSMPYSADFYEAEEEANAVTIGAMAKDAVYGVWIKSKLLTDVIATARDGRLSVDADGVYSEASLGTSDTINIHLSWD